MLRYWIFLFLCWTEKFYHRIRWTVGWIIHWPSTYILGLQLPREERQRINKQCKHLRKVAKAYVKRERPKMFAEIKACYTEKGKGETR